MDTTSKQRGSVAAMLDPAILAPAIGNTFRKLDPRAMWRNPVMFVVEIVATLTTVLFLRNLATGGTGLGFTFQIVLWLWITVLFANFAEAVAEGRGKAQAATLRRARTETMAKLLRGNTKEWTEVAAASLKVGDLVLVEINDLIPSDGEVIEGIASVDESAITGESAPVIRESGGDRSAVTRRHAGALGPDRGADHRGAGIDLHRPHDRAGRGRDPAEDAERGRAEHPARRPDHHLRVRHRHNPLLRRICRRFHPRRHPGGAVRDVDPDHHRRAASRPSASRAWIG